jgi:hypothetical protein
VATVLRPLGDDDLDRLFVQENDNRAAFTRADSSDRRSFDAHYHRLRDNRTTRSLRAVLVGIRRKMDD